MAIIGSLRDLLVLDLHILHQAESRLQKAWPKLARAASRPEAKEIFREGQTRAEVGSHRLDRALKLLGSSPSARECRAMAGLLDEGEEATHQIGPNAVRDANLLGIAQRIVNYKLAAYRVASAYCRQLGLDAVGTSLGETLAELTEANRKLEVLGQRAIEEAFRLTEVKVLAKPGAAS
jgi:Mn-containing catalase